MLMVLSIIPMNLSGDERLEAAAACFNKPQYIQLNLATGGNWARMLDFIWEKIIRVCH